MSLKKELAHAAQAVRQMFGRGAFLRRDFEDRMVRARGTRAQGYVEAGPGPALPSPLPARLIAYYLPQFHAIPENDLWWGAGFTEWTNVTRTTPQFVGHLQPRLPGELGFYDLSVPGTLARQARLAKEHGVSAFCFHYYWFAGKRLLERPLDLFLADSSIDIQFCLCWANENWTRRWDGEESAVLMAQQHSPEDDVAVFHDLARYLEDPRAIRVDGKPMVLIYRADIIPDAKGMIARWRAEAAKRGWPGVYVVATNAFHFKNAAEIGCDALAEFPPHDVPLRRIEKRLDMLNADHGGAIYDYPTVVSEKVRRWRESAKDAFPVFPGVMPGWDNEARRPGAGRVYHDASPALYGEWLAAAIAHARDRLPADRRFVFINAWNEWAEGAYLEPDRHYGRAYLHATARALSQS